MSFKEFIAFVVDILKPVNKEFLGYYTRYETPVIGNKFYDQQEKWQRL